MQFLQLFERVRICHDVSIFKPDAIFRKKLFRPLAEHSARLRKDYNFPGRLHRGSSSLPAIHRYTSCTKVTREWNVAGKTR